MFQFGMRGSWMPISASICCLVVTCSAQGFAQHAKSSGLTHVEKLVVGKWSTGPGGVVTFSANKTFTQGAGGMSATGVWSAADHSVVISVLKIGGKSIDQFVQMMAKSNPKQATPDAIAKLKKQMRHMALTLSADGKTLSATGKSGR